MTARKHHYIPCFHLAGFTLDATEAGRMFVLDQLSGRTWRTTPRGAAHMRDFYRIDSPGTEPDAFEIELSRIEARAAAAIRGAVASLEPPTGQALEDLLAYMAVMASRTPRHREHIEKQDVEIHRRMLEMTFGHPGAFEKSKARARAAGLAADDLRAEQMLEA